MSGFLGHKKKIFFDPSLVWSQLPAPSNLQALEGILDLWDLPSHKWFITLQSVPETFPEFYGLFTSPNGIFDWLCQ